MKILAFGHRSRVGKDSAARFAFAHIRANYPNMRICKASFFNPIKDLAADLYSWAGLGDAEYYENNQHYKRQPLATIDKSPVQIWLELGYALRQIHPDTIIEYAFRFIPADTELVIVPDLRSLQEIEFGRKFKFYPVRIDRLVPIFPDVSGSHPAYKLDDSLTEYLVWYRTIHNNGTLQDLNEKIVQLVEDVINEP